MSDSNLQLWLFGILKTPKSHSEINWPFKTTYVVLTYILVMNWCTCKQRLLLRPNKLEKRLLWIIFLADEWQQFAAPPCFWDIGLSPWALFAVKGTRHHQGWTVVKMSVNQSKWIFDGICYSRITSLACHTAAHYLDLD